MADKDLKPTTPVQVRMPADLNERTRRLADREYDGKVSVVIRVALKRFLDDREAAQMEAEAA